MHKGLWEIKQKLQNGSINDFVEIKGFKALVTTGIDQKLNCYSYGQNVAHRIYSNDGLNGNTINCLGTIANRPE